MLRRLTQGLDIEIIASRWGLCRKTAANPPWSVEQKLDAGKALQLSLIPNLCSWQVRRKMPRLTIGLWAILWLFAISATAAGCGVQGTPAPDSLPQANLPRPPAAGQVWLARRGWHIDLGLAVSDLREPLHSVAAQFPQARYAFFGFGDRRYFMAKRHGPFTLAEALWPGAGLALLTAIEGTPSQAFGEGRVIALPLEALQMQDLQQFIWASIETENGVPRALGPGPYRGSWYFAARSKYSGVHTCNTWAAEGLAAAKLPVHTRFVLLAGQLWYQALKLRKGIDQAQPSVAGD